MFIFNKILTAFLFLMVGSPVSASIYSERIKNISLDKISSLLKHQETDVVCLSTSDKPFLIGMLHQVLINASIDKVISVFEDFENYSKIFKDLKRVNIIEKRGQQEFVVEYESIIPIPFVSNSIYQLHYFGKVEEKPQLQTTYRFELIKGNDLKSLDGIIVIKKIGSTETLYQELDFLDADWGIAKTFAAKSIWRDTVTSAIESDFGLKIKSENPKMESKEIIKQSRFSVESKKIQNCLDQKKESSILF